MAEFNDKIIEMGCDFWIDTEEDAPSVVTRMTGIQPSWATTKGETYPGRDWTLEKQELEIHREYEERRKHE